MICIAAPHVFDGDAEVENQASPDFPLLKGERHDET